VQAIVQGGPEVTEIKAGKGGQVLFNQTPFYAESGGQVGDTGLLMRASDGAIIGEVRDTQKKAGDLFVHRVHIENHGLKVGDAVRLIVDSGRRGEIRRNHSATHLLHEALRQVLGDHIAQRGSLVAPDRLRFDFVHQKPITAEELRRVEDIANNVVLENNKVDTRLMAVDDAREAGARALFGEKYGDEVRVVIMGEGAGNALGWSVELCGGTHVDRTGDIGLISVTGESAVASGVRRIEALTGNYARHHANDTTQIAKNAAAELRTTIDEMPARIAALMEERKKLERDLSDARKKLAMGGGASLNGATASTAAGVREVGNVKLMMRSVEGIEMKDLKSLVDDGKKQLGSGVVAIVGVTEEGKAGVVVGVTSDLTSRYNAVDLVRVASEALGGKGGGGRPDMAQAGGPDGAKASAALDAIEKAMAGA
jgi:alanyl-tRNA synthetase